MSDIERTLALELAKNDIKHLEREMERAIEDVQKANHRIASIRTDLSLARLRHDHIADGGDLEAQQ